MSNYIPVFTVAVDCSGFTDIHASIAQLSVAMEKAYGKAKVATIETRVWGLVTLGGILLLMARAFKWI